MPLMELPEPIVEYSSWLPDNVIGFEDAAADGMRYFCSICREEFYFQPRISTTDVVLSRAALYERMIAELLAAREEHYKSGCRSGQAADRVVKQIPLDLRYLKVKRNR